MNKVSCIVFTGGKHCLFPKQFKSAGPTSLDVFRHHVEIRDTRQVQLQKDNRRMVFIWFHTYNIHILKYCIYAIILLSHNF